MLNTLNIMKILKGINWFGGVFAINRLPTTFKKPKTFIINLDPSYKIGSHWVAVHFSHNGTALYFDSFGSPPEGLLLSFIEKNAPMGFLHSKSKYQGNFSVACGYFCKLFVLLAKHSRNFFRLFEKCKYNANEKTLKALLKKILRK